MELLLIAFAAGMLTVLTPCVLPVLPVILGGSLSGEEKWRPLIISFSLIVSVFLFSLLLKASTVFIDVPPSFWKTVSGGIVLIFGLTLLFPQAWSSLAYKLGLTKSEGLLQKASSQGGVKGLILLGLALGPVFASCSPTYALIIAVVLPAHFSMGVWALFVYCLGLFVPLLLIGYGGRRVLVGFKWFANPMSWFRRGLGVLLIVVGILITTGIDKKLEAGLLNQGYFDFTKLEQGLVERFEQMDMEQPEELVDPADALELRMKELLRYNYAAPELVEPRNWINSDPLTLAQLQAEGKVVLLDFWTYSCINCIRTLPALKALHEKYADEGLVIIGVHAPEFAFEKKLQNLQREVAEFGLEYPIFQDNDFKTWRAYKNRYWPAKYMIDKQGTVRYTHFGEGQYEETEEAIRYLLAEGEEPMPEDGEDFSFVEASQEGVFTLETYLGTKRHEVGNEVTVIRRQAIFASPEAVSTDGSTYTRPEEVSLNHWWLTGEWRFDGEKVVSMSPRASIGLVYKASAANLVMGPEEAAVNVKVFLDGEEISEAEQGDFVFEGGVFVSEEELYYLSEHDEVGEHTIELKFEEPGIELYAWTFG